MVEEGTRAADQDVSISSWEPWGHETIAYHFRSRRQFLDHPVAPTRAEAPTGSKGSPPPPPVKRYPGSPRTALPSIGPLNAGLEATLRRRRTSRRFAHEPLPLRTCAILLGLSFGATERLAANPFGEALLRPLRLLAGDIPWKHTFAL